MTKVGTGTDRRLEACLRRTEVRRDTWHADELVPDAHDSPVLVDAGGAQPEQLSLTQPAADGGDRERSVLHGRGRDQRVDLLDRQRHHQGA